MNEIVGIAAEYNPFHRGHLYHIEQVRRHFPGAAIVAALSSSFLQRGVPALTDKWRRAQAAVKCGVDLVIELPLPFCCSNAGVFASGAVALMKASGIVNVLSFGMENPSHELCTISDILVQEPPPFKLYLREFLESGLSYAESRSRALDRLCPGAAELTGKPNNTLAVAYAEAVKRQGADLELLPVPRRGADYHDLSEGAVMSAQGIREALKNGRNERALRAMPHASAEVLREALASGQACCDTAILWQHLRLLLSRLTPEELSHTAGISEGMEHRLLQVFLSCESFEELTETVSSRRFPQSRIRRQLMALLLNVSHEEDRAFQRQGPAYIRPLAMNSRGRRMLRSMEDASTLPVITKPAALHGRNYAQSIMALEFRGAAVWQSLTARPDFEREKKAVPWIADF